jgi:hypothetical protein
MIEFAAICLAANIYFEARNQTEEGQIAVAQVTMNRAGYDVNKVCEVTLKRKQFSWLNGKTKKGDEVILAAFKQPKDKKAWTRAKKVANKVLGYEYDDIVGDATHYHTTKAKPYWSDDNKLQKIGAVGDHVFYRKNKTKDAVIMTDTPVVSFDDQSLIERTVYEVPEKPIKPAAKQKDEGSIVKLWTLLLSIVPAAKREK